MSKNVLPATFHPAPDELLSSWLTRLAHNHLVKVHSFCKAVVPNISIWNRDVDKLAPQALLRELANRTLTPLSTIQQTTLASYEGRLYLQHNPYGNTRWILPLGVYHRRHRQAGLVFCPTCLQRDGAAPYFRKVWRLAFAVVCPRCRLHLLERCPQCHQPITFYRVELGRKHDLPNRPITDCFQCGFDLTRSPHQAAPVRLVRDQARLYRILREGWHQTVFYPHLYFDVLHQILKIVLSPSSAYKLLHADLDRRRGIDPAWRISITGQTGFEWRPLAVRTEALKQALWLLDDWPRRFVALAHYHGLYSMFILRDMADPPFWFQSVVVNACYKSNVNRRFWSDLWSRRSEGINRVVAPLTGYRGGPRVYSATDTCAHCGSSWIIRDGLRRERQRYRCRDCGHGFNRPLSS